MAFFKYKARNPNKEIVESITEAPNKNAVAESLLADDLVPISIVEVDNVNKKDVSSDLKALWEGLEEKYFAPKVELDELIMMCRQLYSLTRAGVVMTKAFRGLADSVENKRLKAIFLDIERSLNQGTDLASSLGKHNDVFDDLFLAMISVGENTGRLDMAFKQLSLYLEREKNTRRSIGSALRYPSFVFGAIAIAIVIMNIFVIPIFADLFSRFEAELPLPTIILIGMSNFMLDYWPFLLAAAIGSAIFIRRYLQTEIGALSWDKRKLEIPIIGSIMRRAMLARFSRSFAMMLESGVPLIQALEMCSRSVGNLYLGKKILNMRFDVERGDSLLKIMIASEMFTPLVLQMIAVGEETGQIDQLLTEVAGFYDEEVDYSLSNLSSSIEPIMISVMAGLVMVLALGIFLPMWDMLNVVQK